jgi:membrane fusion protein, copper/silver efflux system
MTVLTRRTSIEIGAGAVLALLAAVLISQYVRASWPFAPEEPKAHVHKAAQVPAQMDAHSSHSAAGQGPAGLPSGYAPVSIDPARSAALQLSTAPVEERDFKRVVRTVGLVTLDETRSAHVHSKVRGWIDGINVNFIGGRVKAGQPLCSIYSQDVYSAEVEFLSILGRPSAQSGHDPLLDAARRRLTLWDVPKSEIERLERTREPRQTFPLLAPRDGTVLAKEAVQGMYVDPSLELYTLADLSQVWVLADVYEADVPYVRLGDHARLTIQGESTPLDGKVVFLSPTLDEATRTRKVRFELRNNNNRFLPGAFASVEMDLQMGKGLAVPESAVIRTGTRSIAFVAHGDPVEHFEPRELRVGPLVGDSYRVEAGLSPGERVATGAQFLLDSESRLKATSGPQAGHVH